MSLARRDFYSRPTSPSPPLGQYLTDLTEGPGPGAQFDGPPDYAQESSVKRGLRDSRYTLRIGPNTGRDPAQQPHMLHMHTDTRNL